MQIRSLAEKIMQRANAEVRLNEPMSAHTSLKIGGAADIFVSPKGTESLQEVIRIADSEKVKYFIIGNGTNILVSDKGIRGMVIQVKEGFNRIIVKKLKNNVVIESEAGITLSRVLAMTKEEGLTGFEFAAGIPGSVGGAIAMNASTKLGAVSDVLDSIEVMNKNGEVKKIKAADLDFKYRQLNLDHRIVILNAVFSLHYGDKKEISDNIDKFLKERHASQPTGKSAGCIFKNPPGESAGRIIDELGFKGRKIGGAYVSKVHANFIMNDGTATCSDFIALIRQIRQSVLEQKKIELDYEIKFLGNM